MSIEFLAQIVNSDPVLRASFTVERDAPYQGWSAYTDLAWIALFVDDDSRVRVDVYNVDGDTLFSQNITGLPVRVAAAWVREALEVTPEGGDH